MQKAIPKITIGLPVYNGEQHLAQTIESILAQDFEDFELIISDNASTDATPQICKAYAARDKRIYYIRRPHNEGAAVNYNGLLALAGGSYFKWAPHDDVYEPTYLRACLAALEAAPQAVLAFTNAVLIDEAGYRHATAKDYVDGLDIRGHDPVQRLRQLYSERHTWCHAAVGLIRADVLRRTGLIGGFGGADHVLLAELVLQGEFHRVPEPLFLRRTNEGESPSLRTNPTPEELAAWYDTRNAGRVVMPRTRLLVEHVRAIRRAPLNMRQRQACYRLLWTTPLARLWAVSTLWDECRRAVRKSTWDRPSLAAIRRARGHYLPHRLWALLSGIKRGDVNRILLAVSLPTEATHAALLEFVASNLSHRGDREARDLLAAWLTGDREAQRLAAAHALSNRHLAGQAS